MATKQKSKKPYKPAWHLFRHGLFWMFQERMRHCFGQEGLDEIEAEVRELQQTYRDANDVTEGRLRDCKKIVYKRHGMGDQHFECMERLNILESQKAGLIKLLSWYDVKKIAEYKEAERLRLQALEEVKVESMERRGWRFKKVPRKKMMEAMPEEIAAEEERKKEQSLKDKRHHENTLYNLRGRLRKWRNAIRALPHDSPPNDADLTWVFHLLPLMAGVPVETLEGGQQILNVKYIKGAPSRGAVPMLLNAMKDPDDFYKAVVDVIKTKSKRDTKKVPAVTEEQEEVENDPGLEGLLAMQRKMGGENG